MFALQATQSLDAQAEPLRRPFNENIVFNYGFDNNYGSGSCRDFNCGGYCYSGHTGTDHAMVVGTNILAGADGTVAAINNSCADYGSFGNTCGGRCGNYVRIRHADGQTTIYCHMKLNSLTVAVGQAVSCGQKVGQSASSGSSTGPHLHVGWSTNGVSRDLYRGSCTSSPGTWRQQNGYREAVGTSCGCVPSPEVCDGKDNNCNGEVDEGDVCEIDALTQAPASYAPARTSDVNGDGLQDACGRFAEGWACYLATGLGFGEKIQTNLMSDASGWGAAAHYATIRMGDVDGDGLADVCARHSTKGYQCWRSTGTDFEHYGDAPGYTNAEGWNRPEFYTTFRLVDIDGDGRDDVCARGPQGWSCQLSTGTGFGEHVVGPTWSDASGFGRAQYYGTIRTGDLNGDGKQDVCIRRIAGFDCFLSTGRGFERFALNEHFSNAGGWSDMKYWSSLRLVDFDGDGRDDVCARFSGGIRCLRSTETGFGEDLVAIAALSDASGWSDPTNHMTLRTGDVNGDGAQDFCVRANAGMRCYGLDGTESFSLAGPEWSDASGWDKPQHYHTVALTDIDPDRRRDLCARASAGLVCARASDEGFVRVSNLGAFTNAQGWSDPKYYSTLRLGSGVCRPEQCNGFDDDCDGVIDNGQPGEMGLTRPAIAARLVEAILPEQAVAGSIVVASVRFLNEGREAWAARAVHLEAVANDAQLIEALRPATGWPQPDMAATLMAAVAPGEVGEWSFSLRVPEDAGVFDRVLFVLSTDDGPISCPAPSVSLRLGITTDDGSGNNNNNNNNNGNGNNDNNNNGGGNPELDAGELDAARSPGSSVQTTSTSSCAMSGAAGPGGSWPALLALLGLLGLRRRWRDKARLLALGLLIFAVGCEASKEPVQPVQSAATNQQAGALVANDFADHSARINSPAPRQIAVYGTWQLLARPTALLPNSDAPPSFKVELRRDGEPVSWPLGDELISTAVFVPSAQDFDEPPSLAVRTPNGRLLHVDIKSGSASELDDQIGLLISVAANGCCLSYMRGEMGMQMELRVVRLADGAVQSIALDENAWAPAISPDGTRVIYVSATPSGNASIVVRELGAAATSQVLVEDARIFPTGPQPPFWTEQGIAFTSEHGVYLLDPSGRLIGQNLEANGLLVDLNDGRFVDVDGQSVTWSK
ncbi:MAG: VCBS repeat-containing protein [Bradymonadaceae bacterium]|nr:VCBS repeat-containing protein [Lujinxingiaceae bacterium]